MRINKSVILTLLVSCLLAGYWLAKITGKDDNIITTLAIENDAEINELQSSKAFKETSEKVLKAIKTTKVAQKLELEVEQTDSDNKNDTIIKIDQKSLLKIMGATDSLTWQEKYELGVYTPEYDLTWQDDMYNRAYELVLGDEFSQELEMTNIKCKEKKCLLQLRKLAASEKGGGHLASEFLLALKNHPAILESGRRRNVYFNSMQVVDGEQLIDASIY